MFNYIKIADHEQKCMPAVCALTPGCPLPMRFYAFLMRTSVSQRINTHCCPALILKKKKKKGKHKSDAITHQPSNTQGIAHLERGGGLRGEGCNSLPTHGLFFAVPGGTLRHFVLPIPLSKHSNLSSLLTLYLKKRLSRHSSEDQILSSPSFPATSPPSLFPINSEQRTKVVHLLGGQDSIQTPLCLHRACYSAATEVMGVIMYSLPETQRKMEAFSMWHRVLRI